VNVDVRLSKVKPMHASWRVQVYQDMQNKRALIIVKGFEKAEIIDALSKWVFFQYIVHAQ
jgi:hypothetical protein